MTPGILIVGATGNTGPGVVKHLPVFLGDRAKKYRIIALTRSLKGDTAQKLAKIPGIEMLEKNWTEIDSAWLKEHQVERAYVAPHNLSEQFQDESDLYCAMLEAGVQYVVKLATFSHWMYPSSPISYARTHWATENLLSQPDFSSLKWTSLRPSGFLRGLFVGSAQWLTKSQSGGGDELVHIPLPDDGTAAAFIEPEDVGMVAAKLLSQENPSAHYSQRYVLSGPEDITAESYLRLLQKTVGARPTNIKYKSLGTDELLNRGVYPGKYCRVFKAVFDSWATGEGSLARSPTSPNILELGLTFRTAAEALETFLASPATRHHNFDI